jgi:RNA polymerase sigma-70 factor (ECF subfamily)
LMPTRQLEKAELSEVVNMAVADLNERQRMAVLLNKFEHMSYEEIAEVMELSPAAIKSLLSRARANLREVLTPYLQQGTQVVGDKDPA